MTKKIVPYNRTEFSDSPRKNGKTTSMRAALKKLGVKWPGDGDYDHGTMVYLVNSGRMVCLVDYLGDGKYGTEGGGIYVELKTTLGFQQGVTYPPGASRAEIPCDGGSIFDLVVFSSASYVVKRREIPTVLHISYDDLVKLGQESAKVSDAGDAWGLTIALVPRGEPMSVDRRVGL